MSKYSFQLGGGVARFNPWDKNSVSPPSPLQGGAGALPAGARRPAWVPSYSPSRSFSLYTLYSNSFCKFSLFATVVHNSSRPFLPVESMGFEIGGKSYALASPPHPLLIYTLSLSIFSSKSADGQGSPFVQGASRPAISQP